MIYLVLSLLFASSVEVHGHRGARAIYPENTLPAIQYALQNNIDYVEVDLHYTKDHHIVVHHDPYINKDLCRYKSGAPVTDKIAIYSLTLAQIKDFECGSQIHNKFPEQKPVVGAEIPSLKEVLELYSFHKEKGSTSKLNIEIKYDREKWDLYPPVLQYAYDLIQISEDYNLKEHAMYQSFSEDFILILERMMPEYYTSYLSLLPGRKALDILDDGVDALSLHYFFLGKNFINKVHNKSKRVLVWTANSREIWGQLIDDEIDGIITDDPVGLQSFISSR